MRLSLETGEVAVKLAGEGAKQLAILLYAILREQKKTKGKTRLTNMLRSGKELKVFAVKDSNLQLFLFYQPFQVFLDLPGTLGDTVT